MRGGVSNLQGEYEMTMATLGLQVVTAQAMNGVEFVYNNAKDVLEWNDLSVKQHIKNLMTIGALYGMPDKDFIKFKNDNGFLEVSRDQLKEFMEK